MNSVAEENQKSMEYLLSTNKRLSGLTFNNNTLFYQGNQIDLKDLNIKLLIFHNKYDKLPIDLKEDKIDAETFFNIIKINTYKIQEEESSKDKLLNYALKYLNNDLQEDNNNYDIISTGNYFQLANNKNALKNNELSQINQYEKFACILMQYVSEKDIDDYLISEQRTLIINYITKCKELIQNGIENDITLKYQDMVKEADNAKLVLIKKQNVLQRKTGFTNALLVIFLIVII